MENKILNIKITKEEYETLLIIIFNTSLEISKKLEDCELKNEEKDEMMRLQKKYKDLAITLQTCKRYNEE